MKIRSHPLAIVLSFGLVSGTAVAQDPPRFTADRAPSVPAQEPAGAGQETEVNTGQDPTRPLTRLDLRLKHQDLPGDFESWVLTPRIDKPFPLDDGWLLSTRFACRSPGTTSSPPTTRTATGKPASATGSRRDS
jgi:hypothetical protein